MTIIMTILMIITMIIMHKVVLLSYTQSSSCFILSHSLVPDNKKLKFTFHVFTESYSTH